MSNDLVAKLETIGSLRSSPTPNNPNAAALQAFSILVKANNDYKKTKEAEITKRQAISAWRDTRIQDLQNRREILEQYLKERFTERKFAIEEMFERLDRGITEGNDQLISGALGAIVSIAAQSPLADVDKLIGDMNNDSITSIEI